MTVADYFWCASLDRRRAEDFVRYELNPPALKRTDIRVIQEPEQLLGMRNKGVTLWTFDRSFKKQGRIELLFNIRQVARAQGFVPREYTILHADDNVCRHCFEPILEGQPRHTLRRMHYDCYEKQPGVQEIKSADFTHAIKKCDEAIAKIRNIQKRLR